MTARYGDKTELGNPVTNWGRGSEGTGEQFQLFEDVFTAPGTWTKPATVTAVEVIVVGGGGSGSNGGYVVSPPTTLRFQLGGGGGGGGVNYGVVPVTGPVPVTVGAGGVAPTTQNAAGQIGGTSGFGDLTPGFPYPSTTIAAGGGAGGRSDVPSPASIIGGGAGGSTGPEGINTYPVAFPGQTTTIVPTATPAPYNLGGTLGGDSTGGLLLITNPGGTTRGGGGAGGDAFGSAGGVGLFGYGYGAPTGMFSIGSGGAGTPGWYYAGATGDATPGTANTGGGGGAGASQPGPPTSPLFVGGSGGSGIVIVRYWQ